MNLLRFAAPLAQWQRRAWLGLVLVVALAGWPLCQAERSPASVAPIDAPGATQEAPAAFEQRDLDWVDSSRQRQVPVRLYWPTQLQAGQRVPLIVFSHGIGGSRRGYSYLGAYWSSQGYASLHVQHVGSDRELWFGNPLTLVGRLQTAAQEGEALHRVADVRFALDQVLRSEWGARIDADRIVAAGHSYGANTTLLLAGAQVAREGHALALREPRIKAAIIISAPPFYGERDVPAILRAIEIPTLHITSTEDVIRIPGYYSGAEDRVQVFEATGSRTKALAVFEGGSHSMFTDRGGTGGALLNPRVKAATKDLTLAFLSSVLDGHDDGLQGWAERYRGILARWLAPGR